MSGTDTHRKNIVKSTSTLCLPTLTVLGAPAFAQDEHYFYGGLSVGSARY